MGRCLAAPAMGVQRATSHISFKLALSPMMVFAIGIEHPLDVPVHALMTPMRANIVGAW
jgi:hypothetical protein